MEPTYKHLDLLTANNISDTKIFQRKAPEIFKKIQGFNLVKGKYDRTGEENDGLRAEKISDELVDMVTEWLKDNEVKVKEESTRKKAEQEAEAKKKEEAVIAAQKKKDDDLAEAKRKEAEFNANATAEQKKKAEEAAEAKRKEEEATAIATAEQKKKDEAIAAQKKIDDDAAAEAERLKQEEIKRNTPKSAMDVLLGI